MCSCWRRGILETRSKTSRTMPTSARLIYKPSLFFDKKALVRGGCAGSRSENIGVQMMRSYLFVSLLSLVLVLLSPTFPGQTGQDEPSPVQAVAPAYPRIAATAGASGTVVVEVQLNADGTVSELRTVEGVGGLAAAGEDAARQWKFVSTSEQKKRSVRLTFVFNIMPRDTPKHQLLPMFLPPYRVEVRATVPELIDSVNRDPSTTKRSSRAPKKRP